MMPLSLHAAVIPSQRQVIAALIGVLDKGAAHCADIGRAEADMIKGRLAPDMLPLGYQVKAVCEHSQGAVEGVRAGTFTPVLGTWADSFAGLKAALAESDAFLGALDPAELESFVGRPMRFELRERRMDFTAEGFLLSFSQPNFYFHATTAYDILRAEGVSLAKRDFLGAMRTSL